MPRGTLVQSVACRSRILRGEDDVRCLLRNHVDSADDEKPRDAREDRGIDDAQPLGAVHAKIAVDDTARLARSDRTGAGGVVTPCAGPDIILQLVIALPRLARQLLLRDQPLGSLLCGQLPRKADAGDDRVEVLASRVAALLEILEINQRRITGVGGAQHDLAGAVLRMRLQDRPSKIIGLGYSE